MELLDNPIRPYEWGSRTAIAELLGRTSPSDGPEAELWMGAHPDDPSRLPNGEALNAAITADPAGHLGAAVLGEFGPTLPFLAKILAAEAPLSLQVHPSREQAQAGFAAEEASGEHVNYRDANHKPELICALTPFRALAGFRELEQTAALLESLGVPELAPYRKLLAEGLDRVVERLLTLDPAGAAVLVDAVASAAKRDGAFPEERRLTRDLAAAYPGDPGVIVALLLNLLELSPGEAMFLDAGTLHAYVHGVGVEVMASSDNVLRGGLTSKHIDVPELMRITNFRPKAPRVQSGHSARDEWVYDTPVEEFRLSRIDDTAMVDTRGPQIFIVLGERVLLRRGSEALELTRGQSAYLRAGSGAVSVQGGPVYRVTTNL